MRFIASLQIVLQKVHKAANREASDRVSIQTLLLLSSRQPGEMEEFAFRLSKGKKLSMIQKGEMFSHTYLVLLTSWRRGTWHSGDLVICYIRATAETF